MVDESFSLSPVSDGETRSRIQTTSLEVGGHTLSLSLLTVILQKQFSASVTGSELDPVLSTLEQQPSTFSLSFFLAFSLSFSLDVTEERQ